jgi:ABC-type proline/glycine betaine transport system ATPase subunit
LELHIRDVSKTYSNGVQALKDVTLTIPAGMYGLLGPNGAGKSMLMRILATLQEPDQGSIRLGDTDVLNQKDEVRKTLGYLPQEFGVYPKVSAENLLDHFAKLKGIAERRARKEVVERAFRERGLAVDRWEATPEEISPYKDHVGEQKAYSNRPNVVGTRAGRGGGIRSCSTRTWTRWRVATRQPGAATRSRGRSRVTSSAAAARAT